MKRVKLPFASWYGDREVTIQFPDEWKVYRCNPLGAPELDEQSIREVLETPYGSEPLWELARGRKDAVIIVDDLARPTPASRIVPIVLEQLRQGGMNTSDVRIVIGTGCHGPLLGPNLRKKLGDNIVDNIRVTSHNPFDNLVNIGDTSRGTPVHINAHVANAELKVGIGSIIPHPSGFGGGAKIILPGVSGIRTIEYNHTEVESQSRLKRGNIDGNLKRLDMEEAAKMVGLDYIANTIVDRNRRIVKLFSGDFVKAHRAGVEFAKQFYGTMLPEHFDILVANAYPEDVYLRQTIKGMWAANKLEDDGTAVICGACSEGLGTHYLTERMIRWNKRKIKKRLSRLNMEIKRRILVYSPNVGHQEVREATSLWGAKDVEVSSSWSDILRTLQLSHADNTQVAVLPCATIQFEKSWDCRTVNRSRHKWC